MNNKVIFGGIWLVLIIYTFGFAPPDRPETLDLILKLSTGHVTGINPLIITLFNLMGILPIVYACLLLVDGQGQQLTAWKFAIASFGVGAFALLPYLALRRANPYWQGEKNKLLEITESPLTAIAVTLVILGLLFFGINSGDWGDFVRQCQSSKFIHVMSLDFCLLCLLLPVLVKDDLARRGIENIAIWNIITFVPLLGTLTYLCLRPSLITLSVTSKS